MKHKYWFVDTTITKDTTDVLYKKVQYRRVIAKMALVDSHELVECWFI